MSGAESASLADAVRSSGLIGAGSSGVALCSGGADSAALAAALAEVAGRERLIALHVNFGLRPDSDEDARTCAELCERLGVELVVEDVRERVDSGSSDAGNLQARARELRYAAAERLRSSRGLDWIATGHTRTDLVETVIYRLVTSPGTRALLGLPARNGAVVRPLLGLDRADVRALAQAAELPFRDDPSNEEPAYARNRIRNEVLPVLGEIGPALAETIAETRAELAEERDALERLAAEAIEPAAAAGTIAAADLERLDPAVRRLALRALAEGVASRLVALGRARAAEVERLAASPEGGVVELGGGVEARIEHGLVRFVAGPDPVPAEATLAVPGSCRFGEWSLRAELSDRGADPRDPDSAHLDPEAIAGTLTVRGWREGDRIRPIGLGGSKSLQDVFTDRKVPRSLRRRLPVVVSGDEVAWIAGVAVSEEFAAAPDADRTAVITASAGS